MKPVFSSLSWTAVALGLSTDSPKETQMGSPVPLCRSELARGNLRDMVTSRNPCPRQRRHSLAA